MHILITGGTGYIGSHAIVELIQAGHSVFVIDSLVNSKRSVLDRLARITGQVIPFQQIDIRDETGLETLCKQQHFDCCIHFAGLKSVGESVQKPWEYYCNNIVGTLILTKVLKKYGCKNIIFSSSASVYGSNNQVPIHEDAPKGNCTSPYGRTKSMIEDILLDLYTADYQNRDLHPWNIVLLRYFNPIGAHPSGLIGEDPNAIPNNLMPNIMQVATGKLEKLHVFGSDYDTPDGTAIRDYIHVVDIAKGHVKALKCIAENQGATIYNLGTGKGTSVLEIIHAFEEANGIAIPYVLDERRAGDIPSLYADPTKANKELGWKAEFSLHDMCRDSWNWQRYVSRNL